METTVVLNNFPKTNIFFIFFISVRIGFYTIVVVAMVTKFNLENGLMPFSVFTTSGNFMPLSVLWWQNDTKWSNYTT